MTDNVSMWRQGAIEAVAQAIHDEGGGCCEVGYRWCDNRLEARKAAVVALTAWMPHDLLPATEPSIVHRCPAQGSNITQCCGKTPWELPRTDRMTASSKLVTCEQQEAGPPS